MEPRLFFLCLAVCLASCGKEEETVVDSEEAVTPVPEAPGWPNLDDQATRAEVSAKALGSAEIERGRDGLYYRKGDREPYTGWFAQTHSNGRVRSLLYLSDGLLDGPLRTWHDNGRKEGTAFYKRGSKEGEHRVWHSSGQEILRSRFKNDQPDGLWLKWYENGKRKEERVYKGGRLSGAMSWIPSGVPCPLTYVWRGNGLLVLYEEDGTERRRIRFRDGREDR